jgi:hypothetical protein
MRDPATVDRVRTSRPPLALLLGLAIAGPLLVGNATSLGLPQWVGGAVALAALLGALAVMWRAGELRGRFLVLFLTVIAAAGALGWFLRGRP